MRSTSPSKTPLPVSPNASQSEFEALINLLATDEPVGQDLGGEVGRPAHDLKDENGRLDFVKIKALFSSNGIFPEDSVAMSTGNDKSDVEEAQGDATQVSPSRTSGISSLVISRSPVDIVDPLPFDSGLPPVVAESTPLATTLPLQRDDLDLIDLSSDHPSWAPESNEAEASHPSFSPFLPGSSHLAEKPPISLTASLALAREEVSMLRKRVQELEDLIYKSRDQLTSHQEHTRELENGEEFMSSEAPSVSEYDHHELPAGVRMQHDASELKTRHMTSEIDQVRDLNALSLAQTRFALKSLLDDLGLPPSCIPSLPIERRKVRAIPTSSLDEIHRAVDLVTFLDELVWRRSHMGAVYGNAYSEENVRALRERFELWERIVRTRR